MTLPTSTPSLTPPTSGTSNNLDLIHVGIGLASAIASKLIYDYIKSKKIIRVKQIRRSTDSDVEGFVQLYDELIDENIRIDSSEIIRWIDEDRALRRIASHTYHHYLFVGKLGKDVVSFLKVMYCTDSKYLFIAYYGINTNIEQARLLAAPAMMKSLAKLVSKKIKDCKAIICEVEAPGSNLDEAENDERKARIRLFKETARRLHFRLFEVDIEYLQPEMEIEPGQIPSSEESMILLYAPVNDDTPMNRKLAKRKVLEILRFVYLQIYRPTYRHDPDKDITYQSYLNSLLDLYDEILPEYVSLKD